MRRYLIEGEPRHATGWAGEPSTMYVDATGSTEARAIAEARFTEVRTLREVEWHVGRGWWWRLWNETPKTKPKYFCGGCRAEVDAAKPLHLHEGRYVCDSCAVGARGGVRE